MRDDSKERGVRPARRSRTMAWIPALLAALMLASASPSVADEYDPNETGHPIQILAYVLHPVGVALDYLIFRPAHWLGSQEPFKTVFGHKD